MTIGRDNLLCDNCIENSQRSDIGVKVKCSHCGNYEIDEVFSDDLPKHNYGNRKPELSVMVRRRYEYGGKKENYVLVTEQIAKELLEEYDNASVVDRINSLINYMGTNVLPGDNIRPFENYITYSLNDIQHWYYIRYLENIEIIENDQGGCRLTPGGWERFNEIKKVVNSNYCFVAMSFTNSEIGNIYSCVVRPVLEELGFNPVVISDFEHNDDIVFKIIYEIEKCRFVIADVTDRKNNVYWEAGYARGLGKEVIFLCKKQDVEKLEFDTRNLNHIVWEERDELRKKLTNRINATVLIG